MTFLTFFLYFFASHFIYSIVMSILTELLTMYRRAKAQKQFQQMIQNGQIKMIPMNQIGDDGQWH